MRTIEEVHPVELGEDQTLDCEPIVEKQLGPARTMHLPLKACDERPVDKIIEQAGNRPDGDVFQFVEHTQDFRQSGQAFHLFFLCDDQVLVGRTFLRFVAIHGKPAPEMLPKKTLFNINDPTSEELKFRRSSNAQRCTMTSMVLLKNSCQA